MAFILTNKVILSGSFGVVEPAVHFNIVILSLSGQWVQKASSDIQKQSTNSYYFNVYSFYGFILI